MHIDHLPMTEVNERRNIASQVHERVEFDGTFPSAKLRPRKQRQTQIDRC